jgi:outer membrane protein TolC
MRRAARALAAMAAMAASAAAIAVSSPARAEEPAVPTLPPPTLADACCLQKVTLGEAVQRAITRNPQAALAEEEVKRVEGTLWSVRAASLPTLTANLTYTRLDADRAVGNNVFSAANQLNGNLALQVPIIAASRWLAWKNARTAVSVQQKSAADVRRTIAVTTARTHLSIIAQRRLVAASERARNAARAHADFARTRWKGGVGNRLDVVRAEQELAASEAQLQTTRAQLTRLREALGVLVGADGPLDVAEQEVALPEAPASLDEALVGAETRRADVDVARSRVALGRAIARDSWADLLPVVTGTFTPFTQNPSTVVQPQLGWQASVILAWPLFDGGARYGARRERISQAKEAEAQLEAALRQARSDVRAAFESVQRADEALVAAREAARLAAEARDLATLAYRAGAVTNIEVIDAERRARDADTNAALAEDNSRQARLDLLAASGRFP